MVLVEIIISANQAIGLGFTLIMVVVAIVTLILKINRVNNEKLDLKLDKSVFELHERGQSKDLTSIDFQFQDIYKDIESNNKEMKEIHLFMGRIDENLKHINQKLDKL